MKVNSDIKLQNFLSLPLFPSRKYSKTKAREVHTLALRDYFNVRHQPYKSEDLFN